MKFKSCDIASNIKHTQLPNAIEHNISVEVFDDFDKLSKMKNLPWKDSFSINFFYITN